MEDINFITYKAAFNTKSSGKNLSSFKKIDIPSANPATEEEKDLVYDTEDETGHFF